jgi:hypothetical protein
MSLPLDFNVLPDAATRAAMGATICADERSLHAVDAQIAALEGVLAKLVADTRAQLCDLAAQKRVLAAGVASAKGYLAP